MKIILKETIESLGIIGSEVTVKPGYARNYLFPQQKAVAATPENRQMMAQQKVKVDLQIAKERALAEEMAQRLGGVTVTIPVRVSEEERLYGSVTARDIVEALARQEIEADRSMVVLKEPIKTLGTFQVPIHVYRDVEPEITVEVVPE